MIAAALAVASTSQLAPKSGLDLASIDRSVRPQDDLFQYVNGAWLAQTEIPGDRVTYGTFVELSDRVEADLRTIIETAAEAQSLPRRSRVAAKAGAAVQQIVDLYASMMNEERVEALGLEPIRADLGRIDAIRNAKDLASAVAYVASINAGGPFGGSLVEDPRRPGVPVAQISQGGTLLPDRDYYLSADPKYAAIRARYEQYLVTILTLVDHRDPPAAARAVVALETELAGAQWSQVDSRDPLRTANRFVLGELPARMPGFDWLAWGLVQGFDRDQPIVLMQPSFFECFAALAQARPLATWKAWLLARFLTASAPYIGRGFNDARFEFFGRVLTGQTEPRPRWKRGVSVVATVLGDAIGRRYVEERFPPAAKARAQQLVAGVVAAFRQAIQECAWMTAATRTRAMDKLARLSTKGGYPDRWRDYGGLVIKPADLVGNIRRSERFENAYRRARIGQPPRSGEWLVTPQTVNAYYAPADNEIVLPAAMLQPPFFDVDADDAVNYAALGSIVGHEIGHGFDERGRRYDGRGGVRDWWSAEDAAAFQSATRRLVDQFGANRPFPDTAINGSLTLVENIGDLGGLAIAYRAYKASLAGRPPPAIDGFTGDQRFFMGWARAWRGKMRDDYLREWLLSIPYAPPSYRANITVSNMPAFYDAFGVKPGDKLYRDPAARVTIW